ncbi:pilus assembly PilX family protein [Luteimonas granuli]|uniref:Pilus assembly protein n=1 Tax=Luteimonas granuli TaxID=1176533 RepID=A0A518N2K9_9GAMM|nr:PilX N-terminal domain-containing pilus assembly protein [Luteimonas granuli]QDW66138.1 pilus assembly protein [Luteimonas granuli]
MSTYPGIVLRETSAAAARERGVALVVVLLLLLIMTLLGLASMRGVLLEERMSTSLMDRSLMFQAAEAALREGEAVAAASKRTDYTSACTNGLCGQPNPTGQESWVDRWKLPSPPYKQAASVGSGDLQVIPEYFIEFMGLFPNWVGCDRSEPVPVGCMGPRYRITARARAAGRAEVLLQSSFTSPE